MQVIERLKHPLTGLAVVVSALGQLSFGAFEPAWALISATATYWFPALATSGATLLPELGFPNLGTNLLLASGLVYVGVQLDKLIDKIQDWREDR
ncbi:hypothetical protein [Halosimplex halobium]|uniref:hypothetical protein n=1 Tax=Halosimplex halobium TaxID=3396618 RepID=UPI003F546B41